MAGHVPFPLVESLCSFGDPRVLLAYARTMSSCREYHRDEYESSDAAEGLIIAAQTLGPESSTQALISSLATAPDEERADYALALGMLRLPDAIDALLAATRDETPTVRGCAAWALGQIGNTAAEAALRQLETDNCKVERDFPKYCPWASSFWDLSSRKTTVGLLAGMAVGEISTTQRPAQPRS